MPIEHRLRSRESIEAQLRELRSQMAGADVILARAINATIRGLEQELAELDTDSTSLEAYRRSRNLTSEKPLHSQVWTTSRNTSKSGRTGHQGNRHRRQIPSPVILVALLALFLAAVILVAAL